MCLCAFSPGALPWGIPHSYCPLYYSTLLSWKSLPPEGTQNSRDFLTLLPFNYCFISPFFKLTALVLLEDSSREFTQFGPGAKAAPEPCYTSLHCTCTVTLLCTVTFLCIAFALLHLFALALLHLFALDLHCYTSLHCTTFQRDICRGHSLTIPTTVRSKR